MGNGGGFSFQAAFGRIILASLELSAFRLPDCYYLNAAVGQPENLMRCGGKLLSFYDLAGVCQLLLVGLRPCQTAFQAAFGMRDAGKGGNAGATWRGCGGKTPRNGRNNSKRWGLAGILVYWQTCFQAAFGGAS